MEENITNQVVKFKSLPIVFEKEKSGKKPFTIREIDVDNRFEWITAMWRLGEFGYIQIINSENKESFKRRITDITYWDNNLVCISFAKELLGVSLSWLDINKDKKKREELALIITSAEKKAVEKALQWLKDNSTQNINYAEFMAIIKHYEKIYPKRPLING